MPVVKTLHFQCRGTSLILGWGTKIPHAHAAQKRQNRRKKSCFILPKIFKENSEENIKLDTYSPTGKENRSSIQYDNLSSNFSNYHLKFLKYNMTDKGTETENSTVLQRSYDISPFILKSLYNFLQKTTLMRLFNYVAEILNSNHKNNTLKFNSNFSFTLFLFPGILNKNNLLGGFSGFKKNYLYIFVDVCIQFLPWKRNILCN